MRPGGPDLEGHAGRRLRRAQTLQVPIQHPAITGELNGAGQKQASIGPLQVLARLVRPQTREKIARRMRIAVNRVCHRLLLSIVRAGARPLVVPPPTSPARPGHNSTEIRQGPEVEPYRSTMANMQF